MSEPMEQPHAADAPPAVIIGLDRIARCWWSGSDPQYQQYHDDEWGRPLHGARELFEKLSLEAFQSGLSWITVLRRRAGFRAAFDSFQPHLVAAYGAADVERLMADERIIRNKAKVLATISNARITLAHHAVSGLDELIWSFAPPSRPTRPTLRSEIPTSTAESVALSAALKSLGYSFIGPTSMYALMQSAGMVDDHVSGCWRAGA